MPRQRVASLSQSQHPAIDIQDEVVIVVLGASGDLAKKEDCMWLQTELELSTVIWQFPQLICAIDFSVQLLTIWFVPLLRVPHFLVSYVLFFFLVLVFAPLLRLAIIFIMIIPALLTPHHLVWQFRNELLPKNIKIVGYARTKMSDEDYKKRISAYLNTSILNEDKAIKTKILG